MKKTRALSCFLIPIMVCTMIALFPMEANANVASPSWYNNMFSNSRFFSVNVSDASEGYAQNNLSKMMKTYPQNYSGSKAQDCFTFAEACMSLTTSKTTKKLYNYRLTVDNLKKLTGLCPITHLRLGKYKCTTAGDGNGYGHSIIILRITNNYVYYADTNYWYSSDPTNKKRVKYYTKSLSSFVSWFGNNYNYINWVVKPYTYKKTNGDGKFAVNYESNNANGTMLSQRVRYKTTTATFSNAFKKPGYTFKYWIVRRDTDRKYYYYKKTVSNGVTSYTYEWKPYRTSGYSGWTLYKLPNKGTVRSIAPAGYSITLRAQWQKQ